MNDELSMLALKYKVDKCPQLKHGYTPYYYGLLKDKKQTIKKVLEIGAGEGASLRMWRDFFLKAEIYGAEIDPKRIFTDGRIKIVKCDQSSKNDLVDLISNIGPDIDLVIDDGSHIPKDQVFTCLTLMPMLKKDVIYVIEDVADLTIEEQLTGYELVVPQIIHTKRKYDDRLFVIRNKPSEINTQEYILKKYNINPKGQSCIEIPNTGRNNLAELFSELNFREGAEIGVSSGHYSEILCKANPKLLLYSIDPWEISAYGPGVIPSEVGIVENQESFEAEYQEAKKRLAHYNCRIIRETSVMAAKDFTDNSLDFVYIDANHDFVNATIDIDTWKKKVRPGGILAGHDYVLAPYEKRSHVKYVVDAYFQCYKMIPYFILGAKTPKEKLEIRDRVRSWFWIK